jgi:mono/diheme cytochrome c family protein
MSKTKWCGVVAASAALLLTACGDAEPEPGTTPGQQQQQVVGEGVDLPAGVTLDMVQSGRTVFQTTVCFTCHGMDGSGTALGPSLRDTDWLNSDGSFEGIMGVVRNGVAQPQQYPSAMPPMGGAQLTEDQIRDVSAYVYAIAHGG